MNDTTKRPLPNGWRWARLGDVIREAQGGFASGERDPNGVIQLRMNNVTPSGRFDWSSYIRVPADSVAIAAYRLERGDVLFNNTNSTDLVGKSALFESHKEPVVFSNHFTRIRTVADRLSPGFLAFWLQAQWQQRVFENICNRWIGQSAVQRDKLLALEIPFPQLPEQQRIAAILSEQMEAVERARRAAEARLEAARALPAAYLRAVFDSPEAQQWPRKHLREICVADGQYGTSDKADDVEGGLPVLRMGNLFEGRIRWLGLKFIRLPKAEEGKYRLTKGDLLFNRTNSAELVGKTAVFDGEHDAVFASYLIRFRLVPNAADPAFVSAYINSQHGRVFIEQNMARAIGQVNVSASAMHRMPIPLPPLAVQQRIVSILSEQMAAVEQARTALREEMDTINKLPASLLRRAFAGGL